MTVPDASDDSEEFRKKVEMAEVDDDQEYTALQTVDADWVVSDCSNQAAASREDKPLAAAWLQWMLASKRMNGVRQVKATGLLCEMHRQPH